MEKYPKEIYEDPHSCGTLKLYKYREVWLWDSQFPDQSKIDNILNIVIRPSDVLAVCIAKSGTTWLQEIIWKVSSAKDPQLIEREEAKGKKTRLDERYSFPAFENNFDEIKKLPSPRFFKFHNPFQLLPTAAQEGTGKIIYMARDVRDVAVSQYHFRKYLTMPKYTGTIEDICKDFLNGTVNNGPWLNHVKDFWDRRHQPNILFLTYENMKQMPAEEIRRVGEFLGVTLTQTQVDDIVRETSFEEMKKRDTSNYSWMQEAGLAHPDKDFMRKGVIGDWKNSITPELGRALKKKLLDPLRDCGLVFQDS